MGVETLDLHEETLKQTMDLLNELSSDLCCVITVVVTGILAPVLLFIAVPWAWINERSLVWVARSERAPFGQFVAQHILVHVPLTTFRVLAHLGNALVSAFVFVDLEVGPLLMYLLTE